MKLIGGRGLEVEKSPPPRPCPPERGVSFLHGGRGKVPHTERSKGVSMGLEETGIGLERGGMATPGWS